MNQILKKVKLKKQNRELAEKIEYEFSVSPLTSRILAARGFKADEQLKNYLIPTLKSGLPNPNELLNLEKAVELIYQHAKKGSGVAIACDFDVDGLSGGSLVYHFLKSAGVRSKVYVPDRFTEGYGLNDRIILDALTDKFGLLLTIDYGTTNVKELNLARSKGLETIVLDHHHVEEAPPSDVFVNPHQSGCGFASGVLSAAGLAWFLVVALSKKFDKAPDPKSYLDIACLGTICDMVPLIGANRIIARRGLESLSQTERPGLVALKNLIGAPGILSCSHVSFGIGPRLNAAGRMVNGEMVVELLTTKDSKKAETIAKRLHRLNKERQDTEETVRSSAINKIEALKNIPDGLVVWDKEYHTGVIGIVAQRLVEQYYRPAAVMGYESGYYKGSVRGIPGVSVVELLGKLSNYLEKFGGHTGAGGFSIREEKVKDFAESFNEVSNKMLEGVERSPVIEADTECELPELTPAIVRELKRFEPLGMGNPGPQVMVRSLKVKEMKILKDAHLKVVLANGNLQIAGMMWRTTQHPSLEVGATVDIVGRPDINTFFGHTEIQMNLSGAEGV